MTSVRARVCLIANSSCGQRVMRTSSRFPCQSGNPVTDHQSTDIFVPELFPNRNSGTT